MEIMQNENQVHSIKKGYLGYVEHIAQYTGTGANIVVNIHTNSGMNFHMHDFYEINYIFEGECNNLFEDGHLAMKKGDFVIIHPAAMHSLFVDNTSTVYNFIVSKEFIYNLFSKIKNCENLAFSQFIKTTKKEGAHKYLYIKESCKTSSIANNLINIKNSSVKNLLLEALVSELLLTVSTDNENTVICETTVQGTTVLQNILTRMQYDYKNISLDIISKEYGYSKAHICKLFKNRYNSTFSQKLNEIRILHAKKLLSDTNMSVADISYKLGFESTEYFYRLFKKSCNETPNSYRSKVRNEQTIKE